MARIYRPQNLRWVFFCGDGGPMNATLDRPCVVGVIAPDGLSIQTDLQLGTTEFTARKRLMLWRGLGQSAVNRREYPMMRQPALYSQSMQPHLR